MGNIHVPVEPNFNALAHEVHKTAVEKGFWDHADADHREWAQGLKRLQRGHSFQGTNPSIVPEKLMLVVTEVSEAMEAYRDDDHAAFVEELADTVIRILDLAAYTCSDLDRAVVVKMEKNKLRPHLHGRTR